jgi:hypothetical protein
VEDTPAVRKYPEGTVAGAVDGWRAFTILNGRRSPVSFRCQENESCKRGD